VHFNCQDREKKENTHTIDYRRQSNHYMSTRVTPCEKENGCASSEMVDSQI
jgi:hypothetical protein